MALDGRLLAGVTVFSAVIEYGNFARAGEALGISASGVSHAIARLEARMEVRLIERTTRAMSLTEEGRRFYDRVRPSLEEIEDAAADASVSTVKVRGRLKVNVDPYISRMLLAGRLGAFLDAHPDLTLELITRDHVGDLVADGIDMAVHFGQPKATSLVARKLVDSGVVTVASPSYLARRARPATPGDLTEHACIDLPDPLTGRPFVWEFHRQGEILRVSANSRLLVGDIGTMITECLAGTGIAQMITLGAKEYLDTGQLVDLFPDWPDERFPLYAFYPSRRQPPAKVRAFMDFALHAVR
jgi:DNA-binding transcriptional LysR family regulator